MNLTLTHDCDAPAPGPRSGGSLPPSEQSGASSQSESSGPRVPCQHPRPWVVHSLARAICLQTPHELVISFQLPLEQIATKQCPLIILQSVRERV